MPRRLARSRSRQRPPSVSAEVKGAGLVGPCGPDRPGARRGRRVRRPRGARRGARALAGQEGRAHRAAEVARRAAGCRAARGGRAHQRGEAGGAERARGAACTARAGGDRAHARRRAHRCDAARARRGSRAACTRSRAARLRIETLFRSAGFEVAAGPEIEDDFHNFEALNIPANHPARAMHDTFYFADGRLLAHAHLAGADPRDAGARRAAGDHRAGARLPLRLGHDALADVPPGRGPGGRRGRELRQPEGRAAWLPARPSSSATWRCGCGPRTFPFTEPSAEVDMSCVFCEGTGCRVCKHTGWLEISGCGMVHPNVLRPAASIRSATPATPSAWASIGSRCCAMASTTCACSSRTTCASSRQFRAFSA